MEEYFTWDEVFETIVLAGPLKADEEKKKEKRKKTKQIGTKIYCPHKRLIFHFKDTLSFPEQSRYRRWYMRKPPSGVHAEEDVVLLEDIKNLAFYLLLSPISLELIGFLHLDVVDRFLRALILYLQSYVTTYVELGAKRAASAKRAPNPLAGGARVQRADEMRCLRCLLGREYADLLVGYQPGARRYHHAGAGQMSFAQSNGEKDLRIFEGIIQFSHRIAWIALERKYKELMGYKITRDILQRFLQGIYATVLSTDKLAAFFYIEKGIEVEMHRLFRTIGYSTAKRKSKESGTSWEVPEDEQWILYGPKMPARRKIMGNSSLPYEILNTNCDYRLLTVGLTSAKSEDPRITYLENALLAKEKDLPRLGIKLGILGLPRTDFDILLIPQANEDDQVLIDEATDDVDEGADDYETLMPPWGDDLELNAPFPMESRCRYQSADENESNIRNVSRRKWRRREKSRAEMNYMDNVSLSTTLNENR